MGGSRLLILLVSCLFLSAEPDAVGITLSQSPEKSNQSKGMSDVDDRVVLHPPTNISILSVGPTEAFIAWSPPEIYTPHDVNTSLFDPPDNESNSLDWLPTPVPSAPGNSSKLESNTALPMNASLGDLVTDLPTSTKYLDLEICQPLKYFANYTVDFNHSEEVMESGIPQFITLHDIYRKELDNLTNNQNDVVVPFGQGCVKEYIVNYYYNQSSINMVRVNATYSDRQEVSLKYLTPDTMYSIFITAVFISNHTLNSTTSTFNTTAITALAVCHCDWHGSIGGANCNSSSPKPCSCLLGYEGKYCELCAPGYYRTAAYFPCHRCPCSLHSSRDQTCRFKEGFLICGQCEVGYTGNVCHMCDYGYYRHSKYCVPCLCNDNHDPRSTHICDLITGECKHCIHNTTGFNCERCKEGYVGDPFTFKNCTMAPLKGSNFFRDLSEGIIAAICISVILVLSVITGCIVYLRWNRHPQHRPFWTVELKDDHEGVNFNTVPVTAEDEVSVVSPKSAMDDMDFYEKQGGTTQSRTGVSKKYARLHEQV